MTTLSLLPEACQAILQAHPGLPSMDMLWRRSKEIESEIEEALFRSGTCIFIMPVLPRKITPGNDQIFVEDGEVRVRLIVNPLLNETGEDVYEMMAQICLALNGTNPGGLLADNLRLANPPIELVEDPEAVIFDILFTASFQLNP